MFVSGVPSRETDDAEHNVFSTVIPNTMELIRFNDHITTWVEKLNFAVEFHFRDPVAA